jgi:prepilin-type N-terminal cleavage/methylation domain-containing protein
MKKSGFTLIELMIVIAIIAIIAAIAIPGLLAAQRASNERNASASLKTLATSESDFRSNDRDNDKAGNFYVGSIYGLYALNPSTNGTAVPATLTPENMIKLVEPSLAAGDGGVAAVAGGCAAVVDSVGTFSPKASYIYRAFASFAVTGGGNTVYGTNGNIAGYGANYNFGKYAFMAFPVSYSSGRSIFIMNEDITIWRGDPGSAYSAAYTGGATSAGTFSGSVGGTAMTQATSFPISPGNSGFGKLD